MAEVSIKKHDGTWQSLNSAVVTSDPNRPIPFATWMAQVNVSTSSAVQGSVAVTFPAGRFTVAPFVFVAPAGGFPAYNFAGTANTITVNGCNINIRQLDNAASTATVSCFVLAMQMTPTAAEG